MDYFNGGQFSALRSVFSQSKMIVRRLETNLSISGTEAWGSYMGTYFDGIYQAQSIVSASEEEGPINRFQPVELTGFEAFFNLIGQRIDIEEAPDGVYLKANSLGRRKVVLLDGKLYE